MPKYKIDLAERFTAAFGGSVTPFLADLPGRFINGLYNTAANAPRSVLDSKLYRVGAPYEEETALGGYSRMGTALSDFLEFQNESNGEKYRFDVPPLLDSNIEKREQEYHINDALVDGRIVGGGDVIYGWGNAPWNVTLRGLLIDMDNHKRPRDQMRDLVDFFKANTVIKVTSREFDVRGISRIRIKTLDFPMLEGYIDTQPFIIQCKSYLPAMVEINQK